MYYLYYLCCTESESLYIGYTNNLKRRLTTHSHQARRGKKSPLYDAMRKYGVEKYLILPLHQVASKESALSLEKDLIRLHRDYGVKLLNLADGGEGGFVVPEEKLQDWKAKLSTARKGRKPALGMEHTEENKKFFSECAKRKPLRYPNLDPNSLSFKEAKTLYGISKTHYYRLLKEEN